MPADHASDALAAAIRLAEATSAHRHRAARVHTSHCGEHENAYEALECPTCGQEVKRAFAERAEAVRRRKVARAAVVRIGRRAAREARDAR